MFLIISFLIFNVIILINAVRLIKNGHKIIKPYYIFTFIIFTLSQLFLTYGYLLLYKNELSQLFPNVEAVSRFVMKTDYSSNYSVCAFVLVLAADIFFVGVMFRSSKSDAIKEEYDMRELQNEIALKSYKASEENVLKLYKFYHDMGNILQIINTVSSKDYNCNEDLMSSSKLLSSKFSSSVPKRYTYNTLVNAILINKADYCEINGISYLFDIRLPEQIGIPEIDLCKAFTNIIDNSINAAESTESKQFLFRSFIEEDTLYLITENDIPVFENRNKSEPKPIHGYGKIIMNDLAQKHSGSYIINSKDNTFSAALVLKVNNNCD